MSSKRSLWGKAKERLADLIKRRQPLISESETERLLSTVGGERSLVEEVRISEGCVTGRVVFHSRLRHVERPGKTVGNMVKIVAPFDLMHAAVQVVIAVVLQEFDVDYENGEYLTIGDMRVNLRSTKDGKEQAVPSEQGHLIEITFDPSDLHEHELHSLREKDSPRKEFWLESCLVTSSGHEVLEITDLCLVVHNSPPSV